MLNQVQILGALEIGLIYGLVALGVYLTFRVLDFPDLTVDGTFPLGAAIAAVLIVNGFNPILATLAAMLGGALSGLVTAYLNVRWGIMGLLAGILTMTGLYSINLRIMGRPNIALFNETTLFSGVDNVFWVLIPIVLLVTLLVIAFMRSEMGLAIRSIGVNPNVSRAQGVHVNRMTVLTLALSNAIVALGGALFAQSSGFADVTLGIGTIIIGLASVIVGEALFFTRNISLLLLSAIVGSLLYRIAVAFALNMGDVGFQASDLKLVTALLIVITMIFPKIKKQFQARRAFKKT